MKNILYEYAEAKKELCIKNDSINPVLYKEHNVKRGLRDINGKGVVTGLTNI